MIAIASDINEPSSAAMCDAMTWSVTEPDLIVSGAGCARTIRFGASGSRSVRATTQDRERWYASRLQTFTVLPPPENPYPRVTSAALISHEFDANPLIGCRATAVASGATVDLRRRACDSLLTQNPRFTAELEVENPLNEVLSYRWTFTARYRADATPRRSLVVTTLTPIFPVEPLVFGGLNDPNPCALEVTVIAPDATRNKQVRVWSGECIQIEDAPR